MQFNPIPLLEVSIWQPPAVFPLFETWFFADNVEGNRVKLLAKLSSQSKYKQDILSLHNISFNYIVAIVNPTALGLL